jgi:hypothetical protein
MIVSVFAALVCSGQLEYGCLAATPRCITTSSRCCYVLSITVQSTATTIFTR